MKRYFRASYMQSRDTNLYEYVGYARDGNTGYILCIDVEGRNARELEVSYYNCKFLTESEVEEMFNKKLKDY